MSKESKNGKSEHFSDKGTKHLLRSGIKKFAIEKQSLGVSQQAHKNAETKNCKTDVNDNKTSDKSTKLPSVRRNSSSHTRKPSATNNCSGGYGTIKMHESTSEKHVYYRRSPRRKDVSFSSCETNNNYESPSVSKISKFNTNSKVILKEKELGKSSSIRSKLGRSDDPTSAKASVNVCNIKQVLPAVQQRKNSSPAKSPFIRRMSSSPVNTCSSVVKRASPSPSKHHSPRTTRRNTFPPNPLRTSPRRKSSVKYCYGSVRSPPKRKRKVFNVQKASLSPGKSIADKTNKKDINRTLKIKDSPVLHKTRSHGSPKCSVIKTRAFSSPIKSPSLRVIEEKNSPRIQTRWDSGKKLKTEFKCNMKSKQYGIQKSPGRELKLAMSSAPTQKASAKERELKKITDYWSPKQTETNTARILRNGRSLDTSPSPKIKGIKIKQEIIGELENYGQQKHEGSLPTTTRGGQGTSSVRREIQFGDIDRNTNKRKNESTTEEKDDGEYSLSIPRRKKLRSEVTDDELWEGLQIQRFKRLTPKKEKIETPTDPNINVTNVDPCRSSENGDLSSESLNVKPTTSVMQCQEAKTELDFHNVIVKKERFDYDDEVDSFGLDEINETLEIPKRHCTENAARDRNNTAAGPYQNIKVKSELTYGYSEASTNVNELTAKSKMSTLPSIEQDKGDNRRSTERVVKCAESVIPSHTYTNEHSYSDDSDNGDMYGLDGKDFEFQTDTSKEFQHYMSSSYTGVLDLECDTSITQIIDSEKELEDTFMYYDFPSSSELEQSQPLIEFHQYDDAQDSYIEQITEIKQEEQPDLPHTPDRHEEEKETLVFRDEDNGETETSTRCDTEFESDTERKPEIQNANEVGAECPSGLMIPVNVVGAETEGYDINYGKHYKLTDKQAENDSNSEKGSVNDENNHLDASDQEDISVDNTEHEAAKSTSRILMAKTSDELELEQYTTAEETSLTLEENGREKDELLKDASAFILIMQKEQQLVSCNVSEDIPGTATTGTTPIKIKQTITERTTPKRSVRLQERRETTPSKWNEEYVFTPLRRVEDTQKLGRDQRICMSNQSGLPTPDSSQTQGIYNAQKEQDPVAEQQEEIVYPSSTDDLVSDTNKKEKKEIDLDSTLKIQDKGTGKSPNKTRRTIISKTSEQTPAGKSQLVSSDDRPPLKIRVKKSADGTTRIVASPSSKSAILNMCPDNPELVLTPCDKKGKEKVIPMRSLLKPNLVLKKCSSPSPSSKRKRSRAPEVPFIPTEPDNKHSDQSSKKKREESSKCNGRDSSRRHQSHTTSKAEKISRERADKRKLDDANDLLKNVMVGKHASILWLSENRRHFLLKHSESSPSEIDYMLSDAWKNLGEKEKLKYYQRASAATRDENKHSDTKSRQRPSSGKKETFLLNKDGKMSKKMLTFLSLSPMEQHEELRRWLRFFVYEVSPAEYAKLMADFKETVKDLKENHQTNISDSEMQMFYRKILFQKILDIQDKIVDIYHQKREKQDEIVKEGFDILTKRLIVGDDISFSNTVRSDDLQQVLLDLKLLENERKVAVSGTPLKSRSYENVLEQLQECEHSVEAETRSTGSCLNRKSPPLIELPAADSRFANELLLNVKHQMLPHFEIFSLERELDSDNDGISTEEKEEKNAKEIFEKLSKFFEQEAFLNHDMNFWAPSLSSKSHVSAPSSVLTDCLLSDQFKMLARNPSVFGSGVKMLIDPSQLKPFMLGRNVQDFRSAQKISQYRETLLRHAHNTGDKNQNGHSSLTRRRVTTSKYDKYKTQSLTGHSPVTLHYAGHPKYHSLPRMSQFSQIPVTRFPQTRWSVPLPQSSMTQRPRIMVKEPDSRYTSIIHRRIQNVEGGTVVRYTATSMRPTS